MPASGARPIARRKASSAASTFPAASSALPWASSAWKPAAFTTVPGRASFIAPFSHQRAEEIDRLRDALDRAPLVGLVREPRLAGPEHHGGRAAEAALQVRAVGRERDRLRR